MRRRGAVSIRRHGTRRHAVLVLLALLAGGCSGPLTGPDVLTGTVEYFTIEGGFHAIRVDDGRVFDPINLPAALQVDGLRVRFTARIRRDLASFHMVGEIVELIRIERA